ncbi:hypothetical protein HYX17_05560 [Candidatus Woesearchaeota archaeon]|nr:hypothetical protein [Candidatus Woesearchaeota archaeon]
MNSLKNFNNNEWNYFGLWEQPIFSAYFWINWYDKNLLKKLRINLSEGDILAAGKGHFFLKKKILEEIKENLVRSMKNKDSNFADNLLNTSFKLHSLLDRTSESNF